MKQIDYGFLERATAHNVSMKAICTILQISSTAFYHRLKSDTNFASAVERGRQLRGAVNLEPIGEPVIGVSTKPVKMVNNRLMEPREVPKPAVSVVESDTIGRIVIQVKSDGSMSLQAQGQCVTKILAALIQKGEK